VLTTDGESPAGAVGSSTTISVSGVAIGLFAAISAHPGHHPRRRMIRQTRRSRSRSQRRRMLDAPF
jgi:hypothetical protein